MLSCYVVRGKPLRYHMFSEDQVVDDGTGGSTGELPNDCQISRGIGFLLTQTDLN